MERSFAIEIKSEWQGSNSDSDMKQPIEPGLITELQPMDNFIRELDAAVETHMDWTRRVMRCAVLHTSPGNDVLDPMAHTLCHFGRWFKSRAPDFENLNARKTQRVIVVHRAMHDSIRSICANVLAGRPGESADLDAFEQTQTELIKLLAEFKTQVLSTAARQDQLTGLPMRFGIEQEYLKFQKLRARHNLLLYVAMIDIDHFKKVNDTYGHPVGDIALRHVADTLKRNLRDNDTLVRFGGEEFLLLMLADSPEESTAASARLINAVRSAPVKISQDTQLTLTVTMGIARATDDEQLGAVIARADRSLYEGKRAGRDRYIYAHG
ncbi:MAG: diguanylate cyclase [Gallionella sp.]|nr:diguanylate cyclase [Gallionella sp.]